MKQATKGPRIVRGKENSSGQDRASMPIWYKESMKGKVSWMQTKEFGFCSVGSGGRKGLLSKGVMLRFNSQSQGSLCVQLSSLFSLPTAWLGSILELVLAQRQDPE